MQNILKKLSNKKQYIFLCDIAVALISDRIHFYNYIHQMKNVLRNFIFVSIEKHNQAQVSLMVTVSVILENILI